MYKHLTGIIITIAVMVAAIPSHTNAERINNKQEVYKFLQDAFHSQVSLSEEERSMKEVDELLDPYFSEEPKAEFLNENLVSENGKYFTLGSDAAAYYIPFFTYSDHTKVVKEGSKVYVYEYFPGNHDGPVAYEGHYEGLLLAEQEGEFKVAKFLGENIPEKILKKAESNEEAAKQSSLKTPENPIWIHKPSYQFGFLLNPFDALFRSGSMLLTDNKQGIIALIEHQELNGQLASN
ncbi:DUF3993 domain-containing protein [Bacillus sp. CMF12]|uniref:DUF3993 domain-containing protein n=1 Tax=Bacillaceae TaxID=186817 RepID=UPI001FB4A81B|nr:MULTISPECIES: DUF3993 domain-containing protein [Bacillaceae]UOE56960.1 DUF3993 domain-containing protein [Cytobacillus oceanisediminis]USK51454.1 DUF3993 domain-containing protein [Bacillus sp. CMF12]